MYILTEILQILDRERPDGVLIAGDVYDKSVPSAEAVALLLAEQHRRFPAGMDKRFDL